MMTLKPRNERATLSKANQMEINLQSAEPQVVCWQNKIATCVLADLLRVRRSSIAIVFVAYLFFGGTPNGVGQVKDTPPVRDASDTDRHRRRAVDSR